MTDEMRVVIDDKIRTAALNAAILTWMGVSVYDREQTVIATAKQFVAYISGTTP